MQHCTGYISDFMERYSYPAEAVRAFTRIEKRLDDEKEFGSEFDSLTEEYLFDEKKDMGEILKDVDRLAEKYNENIYTLDFVFILNCTPILKGRYIKEGIPEEIFYDTMDDMRCKLIECMDCKGVPGTFVGDWFDGFFRMRRFAYGRFQYEIVKLGNEKLYGKTLNCGLTLQKDMTLINFHIPSSGISITDEVRLCSYKKAYKHYKGFFPDGKVIFFCSSWLLFPGHREFLPENSNILRFMDDFEIVDSTERDEFGSAWRVFGKYASMPLDKWPADTSLRRAYIKRLREGGKVPGHGDGIFLFDGEKIIK